MMISCDNFERSVDVLHVRVMTGFGGGPEKTILNSPAFLRSLGYNSACAYLVPPDDVAGERVREFADELGAEAILIPDRGPWDWRVISQLIQLCRKRNVRVWHGHDYKSNSLGLVVRRFHPMMLVTTVHGWVQHTRRTPLYYAIDRRCLKRYDSVICVSEDLYRAARKCGVRKSRCYLIHNAIDCDKYRRVSLEPSKKGIKKVANRKPLLIGAMGRLSPEKGFDLLIRAVTELNTYGIPCQLQIAGMGDQLPELEQLIDVLGCGEQVQLVGQLSDPRPFLESLDLFLLSSLREGLPNVLLEAMAMEVPIVSTRIAGIPRLIQSGENGILVEPNSVAELKSGILAVAHDADLRDQLAQAGRRTIEQSFSFQHRMEKIAAIYDGLLKSKVRSHLAQVASVQ
jgi:glycosyltransferase involved in cell wall biosynthesis